MDQVFLNKLYFKEILIYDQVLKVNMFQKILS
jgi:hypothetical protein